MRSIFTIFLILIWTNPVLAVDMPLKGLDGKIDQLSDYKGKWVVANYWATWCPPCREEMPELQGFHDDHHKTDGVVIGINAENAEQKKIETFLEDYFITYPNYISGPVTSSELGRIPGLPTTFLVSPEGESSGQASRRVLRNK